MTDGVAFIMVSSSPSSSSLSLSSPSSSLDVTGV
jgi:hypothetical protein